MPSGDSDSRPSREYVASVIVPAHNEARVIERCLRSLLDGAAEGELEIVVACNGCTDDTAAIAAAVDPSIRVVSTPVASKWGALDLGDAHASTFPRMYIDADVEVSRRAVQSLAAAMATSGAAVGAPTLRFPDMSTCRLPIRLFYRGWRCSPYFDDRLVGFGFYAISQAGRERFGRFPETMAEDYFLHRLFADEDRTVDPDSWFTPLLPQTLTDIIGVHSRQLVANSTLDAVAEGEGVQLPPHHRPAVWLPRAARDPRRWPALAAFVSVRLVTMAVGARKRRQGEQVWTRDAGTHDGA
ncbi:MAG: glycosyltransferase [Acidimicrobiales bacterium]